MLRQSIDGGDIYRFPVNEEVVHFVLVYLHVGGSDRCVQASGGGSPKDFLDRIRRRVRFKAGVGTDLDGTRNDSWLFRGTLHGMSLSGRGDTVCKDSRGLGRGIGRRITEGEMERTTPEKTSSVRGLTSRVKI